MKGEIDVEQFLDYHARQQRLLEWWYLKAYWSASDEDKPRVLALYGPLLAEALRKYYRRFKYQYMHLLTYNHMTGIMYT